MKKLIAQLVLPAYLLGLVYMGFTMVSEHMQARSILKDSTVVEAPMEFVRTTSRTKKGHTTVTYVFTYSYAVDGKDYVSRYSAVNEHGEAYLDKPVLTIAYSNADPSKADKLSILEKRASLGKLIGGFLMMWLIISLGALFTYGWAMADEPDDEDAQEADDTEPQPQPGA